jgi:hypothetical protein
MQSFQVYVEKMGSNFLVAAMIPSLAFITSVMLVFQPIFPGSIIQDLKSDFNPLLQYGLITLVFTVILGFTLTSLNTFVFKLFEGYVLLHHFSALRKRQIKAGRRLKRQIRYLDKKLGRMFEKDSETLSERSLRIRTKLRYQLRALQVEYDSTFPFSEDLFLPTKFGNILKASEAYPRDRYNIDAVPIWPRLVNVIPDKFFGFLDQKNNQLSFLLNCSVLSLLFSIACVGAILYQALLALLKTYNISQLLYFVPINLAVNIYLQRVLLYIGGLFLGLALAYLFHRATLFIVSEYGDLVRSAFDLFRFDLLAQLKRNYPKDYAEELLLWDDISDFFSVGPNSINNFRPFKYNHGEYTGKADQ